MALVKEDGSVVAGANSYADASDADTFQTDRGRQAWLDADAAVKDAALVRATDYIETRFGLRFAGDRLGDAQTLSWPRSGAKYPGTGNDFPTDEVPVDIVNATILYAEQTIGTGLLTSEMTELEIVPELDSTGRTVTSKREKVDVLEESTQYSGGSSLRTIQPIPQADRLVRRWLVGKGVIGLTLRAG